jgi:hypothetical protein
MLQHSLYGQQDPTLRLDIHSVAMMLGEQDDLGCWAGGGWALVTLNSPIVNTVGVCKV